MMGEDLKGGSSCLPFQISFRLASDYRKKGEFDFEFWSIFNAPPAAGRLENT
jgi:hypothetical protein